MNEWNFNKNDLEKIIKTGEILLNQKLPKKAKEEVLNEINTLKNFINGNYNEYEREYVDNRLFFIKW